MGNQPGKEKYPKTPLGCVLKHWKDISKVPSGTLSKKTLLKYCVDWWPLYKLDEGEKWPPEGTLKYNTILQLLLFLRRMGKWDEAIYADLFFTLRNKPEWQRNCGINIAPQDPFVLALERDQKNHKPTQRCCDACSIGQRCLKIKQDSEEESILSLQEIQPHPPAVKDDSEGETSHPYQTRAAERKAKEREGGKAKDQTKGTHTIAPLRQIIPMGGEQSRIKVPFTTNDLNSWREEAKHFRVNPEGVAKRFELMAKNLDIDWEDIDLMLSELTETEKELVLKTGKTHAALISEGRGDIFPTENPKWDPNDPAQYNLLIQYRRLIALSLRNAIPKAINWAALYNVRQGRDETPSDFLERLRAAMRQYTPLDPASDTGKQQLLSLLMGQSAPDIRKKLQKMEHPADKDLEMLINEAWKVFNNREKREDKRLTKAVTVALAAQDTKRPGTKTDPRGESCGKIQQKRGFSPRPHKLEKDQCAYCLQKGHWKSECPKMGKKRSVIAYQGDD